jgi:hypothetical protein
MDRRICKFCKRKFTAISNCCRHEKHRCTLNPDKIIHKFMCCFCNKNYSTLSSCTTHEKSCPTKPIKKSFKITPKINSTTVKNKINSTTVKHKVIATKKHINATKKNKINATLINDVDVDVDVSSGGTDLNIDVSSGGRIYYISDDILHKFQTNMGNIAGIDYLLSNFMKHQFGNIIDKAYLDDHCSDEYPMASKGNNHFRFVDNHGNLIDDSTGKLLVKAIINNIQNSILRVSNILIRRYSASEQASSLYDAYDLGKIQQNICDMLSDKIQKQLKKYLNKRIINPNHLFFKDDKFMEVKNAIFDQFNKQNELGNIT